MTDPKRIAVLGGGSGAHAMAADLALKGYKVSMCEAPEFKENISVAVERQAIDFIDAWGEKQTVKLNMVTTNFEEALEGVSYIMMVVPAVEAKSFFDSIVPYLEDGQTIIKWSANFSALLFANMLREKGIKKDITLAEAHRLPWLCELVAPGTVQIMVWATKFALATLPAKKMDRLDDVKNMYHAHVGNTVLNTSFNNPNPIVHPIGTVMNAGWIDTVGKDFHFYRDGNTLSISRGIKSVFDELDKLANAVGTIRMMDYPEEDFWKKSGIMSSYAMASFDKEGVVAKISGPSSVKSRYITEDVPYGLVPIAKLARRFNVSTPTIDSVIQLASIINQTNYLEEGLSLEELGIAGLSKDELHKVLLETGLT